MSEFENTLVIMFAQKRKHRSPSEKLARAQDRDKLLNLAKDCLENIMDFYQDFSAGYENNNLYGLFNTSEKFYNSIMEFISISQYLYKHKLLKKNEIDYSTIIENMNALIHIIEQLNAEKNEWISESDLLNEPQFANSVQEGNNRIQLLKDKIYGFLDKVSEKIEKEKLQENQKNHCG